MGVFPLSASLSHPVQQRANNIRTHMQSCTHSHNIRSMHANVLLRIDFMLGFWQLISGSPCCSCFRLYHLAAGTTRTAARAQELGTSRANCRSTWIHAVQTVLLIFPTCALRGGQDICGLIGPRVKQLSIVMNRDVLLNWNWGYNNHNSIHQRWSLTLPAMSMSINLLYVDFMCFCLPQLSAWGMDLRGPPRIPQGFVPQGFLERG